MTYTEKQRRENLELVARQAKTDVDYIAGQIKLLNEGPNHFVKSEAQMRKNMEENLNAFHLNYILFNSRMAYDLVTVDDPNSRVLYDATCDLCHAAIELRIALLLDEAAARDAHAKIADSYQQEALNKYMTYTKKAA